jgi:hypothetical protein
VRISEFDYRSLKVCTIPLHTLNLTFSDEADAFLCLLFAGRGPLLHVLVFMSLAACVLCGTCELPVHCLCGACAVIDVKAYLQCSSTDLATPTFRHDAMCCLGYLDFCPMDMDRKINLLVEGVLADTTGLFCSFASPFHFSSGWMIEMGVSKRPEKLHGDAYLRTQITTHRLQSQHGNSTMRPRRF